MFFLENKVYRTNNYIKFLYGHKEKKCGACNGSGYYDSNGSPDCGCCDGTGRETYQSSKSKIMIEKINTLVEKIKAENDNDIVKTAKQFSKMTKNKLFINKYSDHTAYFFEQYSVACAFIIIQNSDQSSD